MDLETRFRSELRALGIKRSRLLLAVSGGPDSVALVELMARCVGDFELSLVVAHVDHGIAVDSAAVARMVAALATRHALPFLTEALGLGAATGETVARARRWSALERMRRAARAEWIVTAHQSDDQAETVLMRVLRGTGPAGLAGMQARTGTILRPLLPFRRDELAQYVHDHGIECWSDPANEDVHHDRSWIRHRALPLLRERWPDVSERLSHVSTEAGRWRRAWDEAVAHLPGLDLRLETDGISVAGGALRGYSSDLARAVLRTLGFRVGVVISVTSTDRVLELVRHGRSGSWVPLGREWRASLSFGRLRIERPEAAPAPVLAQPEPSEVRWGEWIIHLQRDVAPAELDREATTIWLPLGPVIIRSRRNGDRLQPLGGTGHRTVARLLQEARVPLGRRVLWPVLEFDGAPVWIPGICRSHDAVPDPGTEALRIDAEHG